MSTRSLSQNNLYFLIIGQAHEQALKLHLTVKDDKYMRYGLKELDSNYPKMNVDEHGAFFAGKPFSSAKLTTKQMKDHIDFIIDFMSALGIELQFVKDEFERTIRVNNLK